MLYPTRLLKELRNSTQEEEKTALALLELGIGIIEHADSIELELIQEYGLTGGLSYRFNKVALADIYQFLKTEMLSIPIVLIGLDLEPKDIGIFLASRSQAYVDSVLSGMEEERAAIKKLAEEKAAGYLQEDDGGLGEIEGHPF